MRRALREVGGGRHRVLRAGGGEGGLGRVGDLGRVELRGVGVGGVAAVGGGGEGEVGRGGGAVVRVTADVEGGSRAVDAGRVGCRLQSPHESVHSKARKEAKAGRTYLPMIFLSALERTFHGKTLTSFSMLRGLGAGKPMMSLKNGSESVLLLETVMGLKPSRFRRMRFFSSTVNCTPTRASRR